MNTFNIYTKNYSLLLFTVMTLFIVSCKQTKNNVTSQLRKLTDNELTERSKNNTLFDDQQAVYKTQNGDTIPFDSLSTLPNIGKLITDRYVDNTGTIKELLLREGTEDEIKFHQKLARSFNKKPLTTIKIDCNNIKQLLNEIHELDQGMREKGTIDPDIDLNNMSTVTSLIQQCGMPTLNEVDPIHMETIWLVIQHTHVDYQMEYFPLIQKATANGDLPPSYLAYLEDRILVDTGKRQKYGSQIKMNQNNEFQLFPIENPSKVDLRRNKVGLGPLKEYVKEWNINFDVPQETE